MFWILLLLSGQHALTSVLVCGLVPVGAITCPPASSDPQVPKVPWVWTECEQVESRQRSKATWSVSSVLIFRWLNLTINKHYHSVFLLYNQHQISHHQTVPGVPKYTRLYSTAAWLQLSYNHLNPSRIITYHHEHNLGSGIVVARPGIKNFVLYMEGWVCMC